MVVSQPKVAFLKEEIGSEHDNKNEFESLKGCIDLFWCLFTFRRRNARTTCQLGR